MIRLKRSREEDDIPVSLRGDKRREREGELLTMWRDHLRDDPEGKPVWKTNYWKAGKEQLKAESFGKCAYCESPTDVVAHGDVEHFRPKSKYWWLAYCLDNHLFACQICNQTHKSDKFPVIGPGMTGPRVTGRTADRTLEGFIDTFAPDPVETTTGFLLDDFLLNCKGEVPGLPDPYNEEAETYFKWEADATNKEVWLRPRSGSARHAQILDAVEDAMGLNREDLRRWRWKLAYEPLKDFHEILQELGRNQIAARRRTIEGIKNLMKDDKPYAAMVRYFVKDLWNLDLNP